MSMLLLKEFLEIRWLLSLEASTTQSWDLRTVATATNLRLERIRFMLGRHRYLNLGNDAIKYSKLLGIAQLFEAGRTKVVCEWSCGHFGSVLTQ
jgi:hypothetical protein